MFKNKNNNIFSDKNIINFGKLKEICNEICQIFIGNMNIKSTTNKYSKFCLATALKLFAYQQRDVNTYVYTCMYVTMYIWGWRCHIIFAEIGIASVQQIHYTLKTKFNDSIRNKLHLLHLLMCFYKLYLEIGKKKKNVSVPNRW